jgi:hypothetical protein
MVDEFGPSLSQELALRFHLRFQLRNNSRLITAGEKSNLRA